MDIPDMLDEDDEVEAKAVPDARARPPTIRPARAIPAFRVPSFLSRFVPIMKLPPRRLDTPPWWVRLNETPGLPRLRLGPARQNVARESRSVVTIGGKSRYGKLVAPP